MKAEAFPGIREIIQENIFRAGRKKGGRKPSETVGKANFVETSGESGALPRTPQGLASP